MKKGALVYWPKGGNVEKAANMISEAFPPSQLDTILLSSITKDTFASYHFFIFGGSTVGAETWHDANDANIWNDLFRLIVDIDFSGKTVAFFGLGDQILYPQHFVDGLAIFEEEFSKTGATIIGRWPDKGYDYTESNGEKDGLFFGLALDEDNESHLSSERIQQWVAQIKTELPDL
jgi:flavodoxin I